MLPATCWPAPRRPACGPSGTGRGMLRAPRVVGPTGERGDGDGVAPRPGPAAPPAGPSDLEAARGELASELSAFRSEDSVDWCKVKQWALAAAVGGVILCE